ncbi:TetR/AcrR family transcriptional regulator [Nocardia mangyaensis]|uniref:TetR/AcrR family transcriptional regulator n=1 Tax=Nocardia mangyaensis TaxID=2213200 RepID=UPI0026752C21|nr:TetR/AcrR family transcriptional regulator [Nocardia mangyaensis]MDO3645788.1 TetR/AcrR family transcriptional regulator [Nocardia mangyaensis]
MTSTDKSQVRARRIQGLDAEQRRARRREQILAAAFELIAAEGYVNTAIEQICQTAFVGNKAFYELFDSKEDCYLALLQQLSEQAQDRVVAELARASGDRDAIVTAVIGGLAHALVDDPRVAKVTFGEASGISAKVELQRRTNRRWAAQFLENLWRDHEFVPPEGIGRDLHALAVATIGGLFDTVADWLHTDAGAAGDIDTLIRDLTAFIDIVHLGLAAVRSAG